MCNFEQNNVLHWKCLLFSIKSIIKCTPIIYDIILFWFGMCMGFIWPDDILWPKVTYNGRKL